MKKIIEKWYLSLILIPIIVNLITARLNVKDFFDNWELTIISVLIILGVILIYEIYSLRKIVISLSYIPKPRDKRIINELLTDLDIEDFENSIYKQNSWYGYTQISIKKGILFTEKAKSINYLTSDLVLNDLLKTLSDSIYDFNDYASSKLYSEGEFYRLAKENEHNLNISNEAYPIMNNKATKSFQNLQILLKYVRERNYLE